MNVRRTLALTAATTVALGIGATAAQVATVQPSRVAVPGSTLVLWSPDHTGKSVHHTVELELVSPSGVRQSIASFRDDARIAAWSSDGAHALVLSGRAQKLTDVTIATGKKIVIAQSHVSSAGFAGTQVVVQKGSGDPYVSQAGDVEMFAATPRHSLSLLSQKAGRVVVSPDGQHVAIGQDGPITVAGTFHRSSERLTLTGTCTPQHWSDSSHLVVSCWKGWTSVRTLLVDTRTNTSTQLTDDQRGRQDFDAWQLGTSTVFATYGPCGTTLLSRRVGSGTEHVVTAAGDDVLPLGVVDTSVVLEQPAGCGMGGSLATYDTRDGSLHEVVAAPKGIIGVTQAVLLPTQR